MRLGFVIFALAACVALYQLWSERAVAHPPGIIAADDPMQQDLRTPIVFERKGRRFEARAEFTATARVILKERYRFDAMAGYSPVDLALGWGPLSDSAVLEQFSFSQSDRFYFWRTAALPLPRETIVAHSANMHMIPSHPAIEHTLLRLRPGQVISFSGSLADVRDPDGRVANTSLTRSDAGAGSCEIVWVEALDLLP